jgi:uncharacterized phage protein (TIGR01671 family)
MTNYNKIRFRAWDVSKKIYLPNTFCSSDGQNILHFVGPQLFANPLISGEFIIEQWSTLLDIDEKPIFEGDILKINYALHEHAEITEEEIKVVVFEDGCFGTNEDTLLNYSIKPNVIMKVIGNTNETPNILEAD